MLLGLTIAALIVVAFLGWNLSRRFGADRMEALSDKRRTTSRIVSRGELVDGSRHLQVVLALSETTFFYENADMAASLDLEWVHEVEYDDELGTGRVVHDGKVLRLRCYSQNFEFVLPKGDVPRWQAMLPPRRGKEPVAGGPGITTDFAQPTASAT